MAVLHWTTNQTLRASATLAANTTATVALDLETAGPLGAVLVVKSTPGASVTSGAGLTINLRQSADGGSNFSTIATMSFFIPSVASTAASLAISVPPGNWDVDHANTDVSNAITVESKFSINASIS